MIDWICNWEGSASSSAGFAFLWAPYSELPDPQSTDDNEGIVDIPFILLTEWSKQYKSEYLSTTGAGFMYINSVIEHICNFVLKSEKSTLKFHLL